MSHKEAPSKSLYAVKVKPVLCLQCKPEYKVPGLYVIDSIVRQSRHQFGSEKDVFAPRFARNIVQTFVHLFNCPVEDKVSEILDEGV